MQCLLEWVIAGDLIVPLVCLPADYSPYAILWNGPTPRVVIVNNNAPPPFWSEAESRLFPSKTRMDVNNTIEQVIAVILHVWLPREEMSKDFGQVLKSNIRNMKLWFWKLSSLKTELSDIVIKSSVNYKTCLWIQIRKSSLDKCCTFLVLLNALIMQKDWPWPELLSEASIFKMKLSFHRAK